ncbi:GAF domain-like [Phytophthora cactorum]|nr:GAF domain-like [Phytophthora cactorum]
MHHRAMRQITDVLGVCLNSTRTKEQWTCLRRDKHQELYAKRTGQGVSNGTSVYYLAVNEASCGFEEAFDLLHFDSTKQFRLMMKLLHGRDFKDGGLLSMRTREHSISDWTLDTQHAAVWFSYQDRRKSVLLREQHLTFFQTLKIFLPENQHDYQSAAASTSANSSMAGLSARPSDGVHKRTIALSWLPFPRSHEAMLETAQQVDLQYTLIVEEISPNRLRLSCVTSSFHDENDGPLAGSPRAARAIARRLALRSVGKLESAVAAARIGDCQLCENKEVQKTRICHLCNNKARLKTSSRGFSSNHHSNNYNSRAPPSHQRTPLLESGSDSELPLSLRVLPPSLKFVAGQDFMLPPPSVDLLLTGRGMMEEFDASDRTNQFDIHGSKYQEFVASGALHYVKHKSIWSVQALDSNSVESSINSSGWDGGYNGGYNGGTEASYSGFDAPRSGFTVSRSFLHPVATASRSRRMAQPIRLAAEASSYSSADRSFLSYRLVDSKEREEEDLRRFDHRRTSLMSSNVGLLDQDSIADEGYFLPKLEDDREEERLKLLEVIVSPACTLVDRTLMHRSCELAAAAFGVNAAFIARVDAEYVLIEHAVGTRDLAAQDEILRRESLCDFVLCQPQNQPLVVLDCLADPRTREIPMVQHLRMHFFIGISVCVRGLPIACLCAFGQDDDNQSEEEYGNLTASF